MAPDPNEVSTPAEFGEALKELAGGRSNAKLTRAAERYGGLPRSTLSDAFNKGQPSEETLEKILRVCGVPRESWGAWRHARERALTAIPAIDGMMRVAQADARLLGVHAPIDALGATGDLPVYVPRDADDGVRGVRPLVRRAAKRGGLVVLVGESSVGKTRCAYEAIREVLPQWWLLHPADARQIEQAAKAADRLVVWLDELHRYLDGSYPLTAASVRALLIRRAVLIATLWPDRYTTYTEPPRPGQLAPHAEAGELLRLAEVVHLDAELSQAEQERAQAAAAEDARIKLALQSKDYGLFQVIAAAPQLVDRWRGADAYAAAVLSVAVDATRLGVRSPLSADLLRDAAPGYCDARQRGAAPGNWFEESLAYLTQKLHGAASALTPLAPPGTMGRPSGFAVADYLQQHLGNQRRTAKISDTTWRALIKHLTSPDDQARVGFAAHDRLLYGYAEPLLREAHTASNSGDTADYLADLLARQGRVEELRARADAGDEYAVMELASVLAGQGRIDEAIAVLRVRADAGGRYAAMDLAGLLTQQDRIDEAIAILRVRAEADDAFGELLADLLARQGRVEELRARADAGDEYAVMQLGNVLAGQGRIDEAIAVLRVRADVGDQRAVIALANLLTQQGQVEEAFALARICAQTGEAFAAEYLADLLARQGRVDELRARADAGDEYAVMELARVLAEQDRIDEAIAVLRTRADTDGGLAGVRLAELLVQQGRIEEATDFLRTRADAGLDLLAPFYLVELLALQGQVEELRTRADVGRDQQAAIKLAELLAQRGQVEELRARALAGDRHASALLSDALARVGQSEYAARVRKFGLSLEGNNS